ncbi:uncharacterized protein MKK02DRAFT_28454 [Dioszegia hungarica]|uniref:Uncharacterized protein n=1 Tax=Dioszegia hungarica TaxID=4972 RepID=A0AA38H326_9TREE|nr:uncharacterized protein MKK02DRAFT_28454 [Dioszegia hungarica]KAI9633662.1 hypothetical protein MKK02DRAFT_28454 [Dioszegia hungarica]
MSTRDDSGDVGFHCHRLDDATNAFFDSIDAWKLDRTCDPAKGYFMELPDRIDAIIDQAARLKALRLACSGPPPHSYPPTDHENAHFGSRAATQSAVDVSDMPEGHHTPAVVTPFQYPDPVFQAGFDATWGPDIDNGFNSGSGSGNIMSFPPSSDMSWQPGIPHGFEETPRPEAYDGRGFPDLGYEVPTIPTPDTLQQPTSQGFDPNSALSEFSGSDLARGYIMPDTYNVLPQNTQHAFDTNPETRAALPSTVLLTGKSDNISVRKMEQVDPATGQIGKSALMTNVTMVFPTSGLCHLPDHSHVTTHQSGVRQGQMWSNGRLVCVWQARAVAQIRYRTIPAGIGVPSSMDGRGVPSV